MAEQTVVNPQEENNAAIVIKPSNELQGFFLTKEGNSILYPLFLLGNKLQKGDQSGRPIRKAFSMKIRGRKCSIEIECADGVPSGFEYDVFNAILALRAISNVDVDDPIEFSAGDIIRLLQITDSGTNYKRVTEAIKRLMSTWYWFDEFFERKFSPDENLKKITSLEEYDESSDFAGSEHFSEVFGASKEKFTLEVTATTDPKGNVKVQSRSKSERVTLFQEAQKVTDKDDSGEVLKESYRIKFHPKFANSIKAKFSRRFEISAYFQLKSPPLRRFFELIFFEAHRKLEHTKKPEYTVDYETLADLIPLNSKRMNKKYIRDYATKLKEMGYISDFIPGDDNITIFFNSTGGLLGFVSWSEEQQAEYIGCVHDILKKRRMVGEYDPDEFLKVANSSEGNPRGLSPEKAIANLAYTLHRRNRISDNIFGYYRAALIGDYAAKKVKPQKTKIAGADQEDLSPGKQTREKDYWANFDAFFKEVDNKTRKDAEQILGIDSYERVPSFKKRSFLNILAEKGFKVVLPS